MTITDFVYTLFLYCTCRLEDCTKEWHLLYLVIAGSAAGLMQQHKAKDACRDTYTQAYLVREVASQRGR